MAMIPPRCPPLYGTLEERREQLIRYRDELLRLQAAQPGMWEVCLWIAIPIALVAAAFAVTAS